MTLLFRLGFLVGLKGICLGILTTHDPFVQTGPFGWALSDLFCINIKQKKCYYVIKNFPPIIKVERLFLYKVKDF
jgi:hypothetical protein